jgi:hypothetical protein
MTKIINTRSPYFIKGEVPTGWATGNHKAYLSLYIWAGSFGDSPSTPTHEFFKQKHSKPLDIFSFEIAEIVNDYLRPYTVKIDHSRTIYWVHSKLTITDDSGTQTIDYEEDYLAYPGWSAFVNGVNAVHRKTLQMSGEKLYYPRGGRLQIPVNTESINRVYFYKNDAVYKSVGVSDTNVSGSKTKYVYSYMDVDGDPDYLMIEDDSSNQLRVNVHLTDLCKYEPITITFFNKWGVIEDMLFMAKSIKSLSTKTKEFNRSIVTDGEYSVFEHNKKRYFANGNNVITLNTLFVDEAYNENIEQLLLSEDVWMQKGGVSYPMNVLTKQLTYKTHINDGLIQHSIEFEYANDIVNNIR